MCYAGSHVTLHTLIVHGIYGIRYSPPLLYTLACTQALSPPPNNLDVSLYREGGGVCVHGKLRMCCLDLCPFVTYLVATTTEWCI